MAHFAQIDENGVVLQVIVVNNEDILDENGQESEAIGIAFCQNLLGGDWVQTSYNNNFRKQYASIGGKYLPEPDVFIDEPPYPSWNLDENFDWQAPVPYPDDGNDYIWDEGTLEWKLLQDNTINVNTADFDTLRVLHGVDEVRAQAIIDGRPWNDVNDLITIQGISQEMVDSWDIMV